MKQLQKLIHKKQQQSKNSAFSISAQRAIEFELKQLLEINDVYVGTTSTTKKNLNDIERYKERIFHFELLVIALLGISPKMLGAYLNIYSIQVLIAYFDGTTPTLEMCEQYESEFTLIEKQEEDIQMTVNSIVK